eukprot:1157266-Pelagomonas_calceolata.AAC.8
MGKSHEKEGGAWNLALSKPVLVGDTIFAQQMLPACYQYISRRHCIPAQKRLTPNQRVANSPGGTKPRTHWVVQA